MYNNNVNNDSSSIESGYSRNKYIYIFHHRMNHNGYLKVIDINVFKIFTDIEAANPGEGREPYFQLPHY